ncbi:sugar phosphate isomerase/epimerase [Streptomyces canus]|uniref:sugar phosphate isomerase/epimerase family protein n=1 Tax=Streptomyces canus TaxID=58343 RepID=UPI00340DB401
MKLGFLTACLPDVPLPEIAAWAQDHGYEALEVAAFPRRHDRPHMATHLDATSFDERAADKMRHLFDSHGLSLSSVAYYDNNLHPDAQVRKANHEHLRACIDAAAAVECPTVGTFIGRDPSVSVVENLRQAEQIFPELVEYAGERGVRLIVENCPMEGWHVDGYPGNLAYSPELWEWMFDLGLYLNYDPSHLIWLGIDPVAALRPYVERVVHAQAKDAEVFPQRRNHYSVFGQVIDREDPWASAWWRYRVPGLGDVDWRRVVDVLNEGGFTACLSVEHEDPVWGGNDRQRTETGLIIAQQTLRPLIPA